MSTIIKLISLFIALLALPVNGQTVLSGKIITELNTVISGANITLVGSSNGSISDDEGYFTLSTSKESGILKISHIGYHNKELKFIQSTDFKRIILVNKNEFIDEVIITGTTDLATDRHTPVAISTMRAQEILQNKGTKELPELLKTTPSVYATKSGGGFGDSRINIRGFDQNHVAVLLNGIPMNDMENSGMYWSNLLGLENVTSAIQVQRGLGYSKLAISSVGGTINFVTNSSKKLSGGTINFTTGNDAYLNTQVSYNTGVLENGFSTSVSLGRQAGDGYVKGTAFKSYNYFINMGWQKKKNSLQFTLLGSPQNHGQRANSYFNMATIDEHLQYGLKYNYNHGYLDGKDYNWTENYFHKPIISLNWDWEISSTSKLSTTMYSAFGRGGGTSDLGRLPGNNFASSPIFRDDKGLVRFDDIFAYNQGEAVIFSDGNTYQRAPATSDGNVNSFFNQGLTRRAFTNSNTWLGLVANYQYKINDNVSTNLGADLRYSNGTNYVRINDLLGADAYFDFFNINQPNHLVTQTYDTDLSSVLNVFRDTDKDQKIFFHADGLVKWAGLFGNLSYSKDKLSGFVQATLSTQSFKRKDYFNYLDTDPEKTTDWINIMGGTFKTGLNYNLNSDHNIFANVGFYSKQPGFEVIFLSFNNDINEDYKNENVVGFEVGYGYNTDKTSLKANVYHTTWSNRFTQVDFQNDIAQGTAKIIDLQQIHKGFELETTYKPIQELEFLGMLSIGDWKYANNVTAKAFDTEQNYIDDVSLNLKGVKVQDAAQFTARLGVEYIPTKAIQIELSQYFSDNLYAAIAPDDNWANYVNPLKLPSYSLTDARMTYQFNFESSKFSQLKLSLNIDNLFDTIYIAESSTNYEASIIASENWQGINRDNKVFFGFGRTWSFSVQMKF